MTATRTLLAALALGSVLGISCYSEPQPPSTYRYACDGDGDCNADEVCRRGHCERPCTQVTAADDCPYEDGYVACYNGACASTCELDQGYCPSGQECIDLGIDLGGSSSPFGGSSAALGLCGIQCDDDDICPEGEICVPDFGACVVDCSQGQDCPTGYTCFFGLCAPDTGFPSSDGGGSGDSGMGATPDEGERR